MLHDALALPRAHNLPILLALCNAGSNPHILNKDGQIPLTVANNQYGESDDRTRALQSCTEQWELLFGVERVRETILGAEGEILNDDEGNGEERRNLEIAERAAKLSKGDGQSAFLQEWNHLLMIWERPAKMLLKDTNFQFFMLATLMFALFAPDLWVVFDAGDNKVLDILLVFTILLFTFEITVNLLGTPGYKYSFFFWMDTLGMLSVIADFSVILDLTSKAGDAGDAAVMQITSQVKLAARAGRFFRLVKLLKLLPGMRGMLDMSSAGTARKISDKLQMAISIRASFLIIFMVVSIPALLIVSLRLAESDTGLKSWPEFLARQTVLTSSDKFASTVKDMSEFFSDQNFFPYKVTRSWGFAKTGIERAGDARSEFVKEVVDSALTSTTLVSLNRNGVGEPDRRWNVVGREMPFEFTQAEGNTLFPDIMNQLEAASSNTLKLYSLVKVHYNFTAPHQTDATTNILLIVLVMILLIAFAMQLRSTVQKIVLAPLEELLNRVRSLASTMFQSVVDMSSAMKAQEKGEGGDALGDEENLFDEDEDLAGV